ncbi:MULTISPECIES: hypothetical protein [unclassified Streptomyces]|nr:MULTISPECIES: hypothetical protein [unclassified Streptomyces]
MTTVAMAPPIALMTSAIALNMGGPPSWLPGEPGVGATVRAFA